MFYFLEEIFESSADECIYRFSPLHEISRVRESLCPRAVANVHDRDAQEFICIYAD